MRNKAYKIQDAISGEKKSKIRRYQELFIGNESFASFLKYELINLFIAGFPGAAGVFLRGMFYPFLLGGVGRGCVFGRNIVFRHPSKIHLGDNVIVDDNVVLDAKGDDNDGIILKNDVFIGRNSILCCKGGSIILDDRTNLGANCTIFSSNRVELGRDVIVAAYTYCIGGGNYLIEDMQKPINQQYDFAGKGGVTIKDNVWIGAHCMILDGVTVDSGAVIAAGAVVQKDVPAMSVAGGIPAKQLRSRTG